MRFLPLLLLLLALPAPAAQGPYNANFLAGGAGLAKPLADGDRRQWSVEGWVKPDEIAEGVVRLAGFDGGAALVLDGGHPAVGSLKTRAILRPGEWAWLAISSDGVKQVLWLDGRPVADGKAMPGRPLPRLLLGGDGFAGKLAGVTVSETPLTEAKARLWSAVPPNEDLIVFEQASATWPVQLKQMLGQAAPQDAWTLPRSKAAFSPAMAKPYISQELTEIAPGRWALGAFKMQVAGSERWYDATVPGTALTTLVDRGVYPDPDFGLNNLAIPEKLAHQNYLYETEFTAPAGVHFLVFNGINYRAEISLNGKRLGEMLGAFKRGRFDVSAIIKPGERNILQVQVSPPPHPGIAHEQSIKAGVGENGGMLAIDGPTFIASEGWDWIPAVRDRNTGIWQDVVLEATGPVRVGDLWVNTTLPDGPSEAVVDLMVPLINALERDLPARVTVSFDDVKLEKTETLVSGCNSVEFSTRVKDPKLWWPNGMGEAALHKLHVEVFVEDRKSDATDIRFGMREISYELSLIDPSGHLRRVEILPGRDPGRLLVDSRHQAIRKVPDGWVMSLATTDSPAVRFLPEDSLSPFLVLRVNGVRVAARGGSWGTDDWRKRVGRERLEPFFRLHKEAHINIIRNWVGQNTEEVFYDLADQYGLLVLNDFWASTQDYNIEPEDVPLFHANAADVISRYRHHPSIALWFGRNEGVPQPILNELLQMTAGIDGTRIYMGSSNRINLQESGPYDYREPASYFTTHSKGFAVEVGSPSFPTLEAFEAAVAKEDRWPINDVWAYHDWHQTGNGATQKFIDAMTRKLGAPTGLEDFERKAQLLNYESYRAIFEGMNAELWEKTSGRLLWMTQPAWPSTNWQILSSDYDTHAAYYGVQKAAEPIHIQMDLPDGRITAINNTREDQHGLTASAGVYGLDGALLKSASWRTEIPAGGIVHLGQLELPAFALIKLRMGPSENFYWTGSLPPMEPQPVEVSARRGVQGGDELRMTVTLKNAGKQAALLNKVTLLHADGSRVLPVYAEPNYVSLLPGESAEILIQVPRDQSFAPLSVAVRGWNAQPAKVVEDWAPQ